MFFLPTTVSSFPNNSQNQQTVVTTLGLAPTLRSHNRRPNLTSWWLWKGVLRFLDILQHRDGRYQCPTTSQTHTPTHNERKGTKMNDMSEKTNALNSAPQCLLNSAWLQFSYKFTEFKEACRWTSPLACALHTCHRGAEALFTTVPPLSKTGCAWTWNDTATYPHCGTPQGNSVPGILPTGVRFCFNFMFVNNCF